MVFGFWTATFLVVMLFATYQHENVHKQIGLLNGATSCSISVHWWGGLTTCKWPDEAQFSEAKQQANMLNSINEIAGYNVQAVILTLFVIAMWFSDIIVLLTYRETKEKGLNRADYARLQETKP